VGATFPPRIFFNPVFMVSISAPILMCVSSFDQVKVLRVELP
jgi:hypothetical protein